MNKDFVYEEQQQLIKIWKSKYYEQKEEIERLKDLCNKYEEEHNTAFKLWTQKMEEMLDYEERMKLKKEVVRLNNIINEIKKIIEWAYEESEYPGALYSIEKLIKSDKELKENK